MNWPHFLTLLRIVLSPIFPILYLEHEKLGISLVALPYYMLFFLIICEGSDLFDGMLARKRNQVTDLGKVLDPAADSITHMSLFFTFTQGMVELPLLLVLIYLYRDLLISTLRTLCALKGLALAARPSGKIKTVIQAIVSFWILLLMIPYSLGHLSLSLFQQLSLFAVVISILYTLISVWDYVYANRLYIKQAIQGI